MIEQVRRKQTGDSWRACIVLWGDPFNGKDSPKALKRGAYRDRKKGLSSEQVTDLKRRVATGQPKTRVARDFCFNRETLYKYLWAVDKFFQTKQTLINSGVFTVLFV